MRDMVKWLAPPSVVPIQAGPSVRRNKWNNEKMKSKHHHFFKKRSVGFTSTLIKRNKVSIFKIRTIFADNLKMSK